MGNTASKASRAGASSAKRILPRSIDHNPSQARSPVADVRQDIGAKAPDNDNGPARIATPSQKPVETNFPTSSSFQDALKEIGIVNTNPFQDVSRYPSSKKTSPAVELLHARTRAAEQADREVHGEDGPGRQFLDASTLRQVLIMRDRDKMSAEAIEKQLDLKKGVIGRIGRPGIVEAA